MAARPRIDPTPEQLQAAWQRRRRRHWPADYDGAMADQLLSRLVHMEAVLCVLRADRQLRRQQLAAQPGKGVHMVPLHPSHRPAAGIDLKRRAAGDTDHDD